MKYNTRFCPTMTGEAHVGHLFMALVNATEAHHSGGDFKIRIDDTQIYWIHTMGKEKTRKLVHQYCEQLSKFMTIDKLEYQSKMPSMQEIMGDRQIFSLISDQKWAYETIADWIIDPNMYLYPYTPQYTIEKVVWDFYENITWIIRGEDLVTEAALYAFFAEVLRLPIIRQSYLPRLRCDERRQLGSTMISKTFRNYSLKKQLDKFGTHGTLEFLKQSCLIDPDKDFYVDNVKWNPTIVGFVP
jgi:glutamyl/glutaminyl-tRNA synthetase